MRAIKTLKYYITPLLLLLWQLSGATTWWVSPTGNDANAGTQVSPFKTVQKGGNVALAGDTVMIMDGTYLLCTGQAAGNGSGLTISKSGSAGAPITIQAQHPGSAIFDGQLLCHDVINFNNASGWWVISGLVIQNTYWQGITVNGGSNHDLVFQNNIIRNIGNRFNNNNFAIVGLYVGIGSSSVTINANLLHDNGPTSTGSGDPGRYDHQLYLHGTHLQITNNIFYNSNNGPTVNIGSAGGGSGNYSTGAQGIIANNTFYGPNITAFPGDDGVMYFNTDNGGTLMQIDNNIAYNTGQMIDGATTAGNGTNCNVKNNFVYDAPGHGTASLTHATLTGCAVSGNQVGVNPSLSNPTTTNFTISNFALLSTSTAINFGVVLSSVPLDYNSVSRSGGNDDGALEFSGALPSAPVITSALTVTGTQGSPLSYTITASNSPTSYGASSLPAGLSVDTVTGIISGTPSASATTNSGISATNSAGTGSDTLVFTINPVAPSAPVITSALTETGRVFSTFSYQITATNSPTSYSALNLPAGLSVNTVTGLISGTPATTGVTNATIGATNANGTGSTTLTITLAQATNGLGNVDVSGRSQFPSLYLTGYLRQMELTKSAINAIAGPVGRSYTCIDCVHTYTTCLSTGTAANQYREVGTANPCN